MARTAVEATPRWERLVQRLTRRWPIRIVCGISCGLVILTNNPRSGQTTPLMLVVGLIFIGSAWLIELIELGELIELLRLRVTLPQDQPAWLGRLTVLLSRSLKVAGLFFIPALFLVPLVLVFPELRDSLLAKAIVALLLVAAVPFGFVAVFAVALIAAIPAAIVVAVVIAIRRRRERRWYARNDYDGLRYQIPTGQTD